jgi:hypothetical protein
MLPTPSRRHLASVLGLLLVLPSSGCLSRQVLAVARGIDWVDASAPPPQSRIVPDTVLFCASGTLEVHANVFPPPDVQWRGRPTSPVRVVSQARFSKVLPGVRAGDVTYSAEASEAECGLVSERARLAIPPEHWSIETPHRCSSNDPVIRTLSLVSGETLDLAPELLDVVPVRRLEIAALSDLRPALVAREPSPSAYALLPLALTADGTGYAVVGSFMAVGYSPYLAGLAVILAFFPLYELDAALLPPRNLPAAPNPVNFEGMDLSARSFANSASLASAQLRCASLVAADLRGARLGSADLSSTRLLAARLGGADLSETKNLTQAQLDSACGDALTRVPPGLAPPPLCAAP